MINAKSLCSPCAVGKKMKKKIAHNGLRVCEGLRNVVSSGRKQMPSFANTVIAEVRKRVANGVLPRRPIDRNRQGSNVVATVVKRSAFLSIVLVYG